MIYEMALPRFAHAMSEGQITEWHKSVGDYVKVGDILFDLETEKVNVPVESPVSGKIVEIHGQVSETLPVGAVVALIETDG